MSIASLLLLLFHHSLGNNVAGDQKIHTYVYIVWRKIMNWPMENRYMVCKSWNRKACYKNGGVLIFLVSAHTL